MSSLVGVCADFKMAALGKKWQDAVDFALKKVKNRRVLPEWRKFNENQIRFLEELSQLPLPEMLHRHHLSDLFFEDKDFLNSATEVSLQNEDNFWPFLEQIEVILRDNRTLPGLHLKDFHEDILLFKIIQEEKSEILHDILDSYQEEKKYSDILKGLRINSPILIEACRKDNYELVKAMVKHGCRLYTSHNTEKFHHWSRFKEMPSVFIHNGTSSKSLLFDGGDEVNDLNILRLMAKKSYIFSCYETVLEAKMNKKGEIDDCQCHKASSFRMMDKNHSIIMNHREKSFHYCPASKYFKPNMHCTEHVECNDPIFRCFDLAKMACEYADRVPEYREEYGNIAQECRALSVEILDQCCDTGEVQTILKESAGASKYLRLSSAIKYPRIRLAIEHNHKEFVGHMYCQQMLRNVWHGNIPWQGAPFTFKIAHVLLQVILAPFYSAIVILATIGRDLHQLINVNDTDTTHSKWIPKTFLKFISKSVDSKLNLDIPLNRFLVFTGYYVLFLVLLIWTIFDEQFEDPNLKTIFSKKHILLSYFALSMLWQDFHILYEVRSISTYFKFWRIFDLILHCALTTALTCRLVRTISYNSLVDICFNEETVEECEYYHIIKDTLDSLERILIAYVATASINRLMYWLQLSERVGPIVINMARVMNDILTIASSFALVCFAFTAGLVFLLANENYSNVVLNLNSTKPMVNVSDYAINFGETFLVMFWTILDPGPKDEISNEGVRGVFATILLILYEVAIIVILLNLLIAVMNATVQRFQDRRQLYWKFARTSVWIDFFDDHTSLQVPFTLFNIFWKWIFVVLKLGRYIYAKIQKRASWSVEGREESYDVTNPNCEMSSGQMKIRKKHAQLMLLLIKRAMEASVAKASKKQDVDDLKHVIVKHLDSIINRAS